MNKLRTINNIFPALLLAWLVANGMRAQQLPMFSQVYNNPIIYNPAEAGMKESPEAFFIHRSQWTDMPEAPIVNALSIDGPIREKKVGLGVLLSSEIKGITEKISGHISYSYRIPIGENKTLSFGLAGGVVDNRVDFSRAIVKTSNDPYIFGRNQRKATFDVNAGASFAWNDLGLGFSVPQLLNNSIRYVNNNDENALYTLSRHYIATAKYSLYLNREENTYLMPYVLMRAASFSTLQYDISAVFNWKNIFWCSASYRSEYAIGFGAGFRLSKNFSVGYSYDFITSPVSSYAGMSHEAMVGYSFSGNKKKKEDEMQEKQRQEEMAALKEKLLITEEKQKKLFDETDFQQQRSLAETEKMRKELNAFKKIMNDSISNLSRRIIQPVVVQQVIMPEPAPVVQREQAPAPVQKEEPQALEKSIKTASNKIYKTDSGREASLGYYIIVGSFKSSDNAEKAKANFISKGHANCQVVYNSENGFTYVYISRHATKPEALIELVKVKPGFPRAWIQELK